MELIIIIMLFVLTVLLCVIFVKLNNLKRELTDYNQRITNIASNLTQIVLFCKSIITSLNSIESMSTPIKTIGNELNKIKDINDIVLKNQSTLTVTKNIVDETRNLITSFKAIKKSKVNKVSSKEKSLNTETSVKSQKV